MKRSPGRPSDHVCPVHITKAYIYLILRPWSGYVNHKLEAQSCNRGEEYLLSLFVIWRIGYFFSFFPIELIHNVHLFT